MCDITIPVVVFGVLRVGEGILRRGSMSTIVREVTKAQGYNLTAMPI